MENEWLIPSAIDGFKPDERKVIYTCLKRNDKSEVLVAQLVASIITRSAYYYHEKVLARTVVELAQNFVGSNNINILLPNGQFGTRLQGGEDAASAKYIHTQLSSVSSLLFSSLDNPLLHYLYEDNLKIEPLYYVPIIPMVLVNGVEVNDTGFSTKVPKYNPRELVKNIRSMLNGQGPEQMSPWYKNFRGTILRLDDQYFIARGEIAILDDNRVEISELPIHAWTVFYKENVLEPMVHGTEILPASIIDYKAFYTVTTVRFVITMTAEAFNLAQIQGFHRFFKLESYIDLSNMVLLNHLGCLKKYNSPEDILREHFQVRFALYKRRKEYMIGILEAKSLKLKNQARFISEPIVGKINHKSRVEMIRMMQENHYDSDPVKAWKVSQNTDEEETSNNSYVELEDTASTLEPDYEYLLDMSLQCLTCENTEEVLTKQDETIKELEDLKGKSPSDLWLKDLEEFERELDKIEQEEMEDEMSQPGKIEHKPSAYGKRVAPIVCEDLSMKISQQ